MNPAEPKVVLPRGYVGLDHEVQGIGILSLLDAILVPEQILGRAMMTRLRTVKPTAWYPIADMLEILKELDRKISPDAMRKVGQTVLLQLLVSPFRQLATSPYTFLHAMDQLYHVVNRGTDIGGWKVVSCEPGKALMEKTAPHHCVMEEGILDAGLRALGAPSVILQTSCCRLGADTCRFAISSRVTDARWGMPKWPSQSVLAARGRSAP